MPRRPAPASPLPWLLWLIAIWCGGVLTALLLAPHADRPHRTFAAVGLVALPVILWVARRGDRVGSSGTQRRDRASNDPLGQLRRVRPAAVDTVARAQALIDGPLGDSTAIAGGKRAAGAITASLASLAEVSQAARRARQAATKLAQQLNAAGQSPATDRLWVQTDRSATELDARAKAIAVELEESSAQIIARWTDLERVSTRQQSAQAMQQARNDAVDATEAAARVAAADGALELSRSVLHDSVDALSARLDALADLEDLSDTLAPLRQSAVVGGSELVAGPTSAPSRAKPASRMSRRARRG